MSPAFAAYIAPAKKRPGLWRTILGLILVVAGGIALQALAGLVAVYFGAFQSRDDLERLVASDTPLAVIALLASFIPFVISTVLVTLWLFRRAPGTLWGHGWLPEAIRAVLTLWLAALVMTFLPLGEGQAMTQRLPLVVWLSWLPLAFLAIAGQTLAEELMFRAVLLQQLAARFPKRRIVWFWLPAIIFAAAHWAPGLGLMTPISIAFALLFGLIAADLTVRTGNLGAAWGLHFANNAMAIVLVSSEPPMNGLGLFQAPPTAELLTESPWMAVFNLAPLLIAWAILRHPLRR